MFGVLAFLKRIPIEVWAVAAVIGVLIVMQARIASAVGRAVAAERQVTQMQLDAANATKDVLVASIAQQQEAIHEADKSIALERAGAAGYDAALHRLRHKLAANGGSCAQAAAAQGSAPTSAGTDLCADLLGRFAADARRVALIAGERYIAGKVCERSCEPLTKGASP